MSFMFNPHPYDDPNAVNEPDLSSETVNSLISGSKQSADHIAELLYKMLEKENKNIVLALDGYIGARFKQMVNLVTQNLRQKSIRVRSFNFKNVLKTRSQLDAQFGDNLKEDREKDPVLLFGKLYQKDFTTLFDREKISGFGRRLEDFGHNNKEVLIVYGFGCLVKKFRHYYDLTCYFDLTPKQVILRAKKGDFANLGDDDARPIKALLRRCYYVDFEVAGHLRWSLLKENAVDFYVFSDEPDHLKMLPKKAFNNILSALVKYPFRCKPVYNEGVWGGHYFTRLRNLPDRMKNCAWVFDLIPLEVSIVVKAGEELLEFPYFTFVQKKGVQLMGKACVEKFGGYFPIRFNYDDSFHSSGNMSVQVHSGHDYNVTNYAEHGRQDESYYIVATGHGARTYLGFNENADADEFIQKAKRSEKEPTPVDYQKYINHVESRPGLQVMIPAGTIHSSGRNQVVLEIGSLTVGSYTYKMYDYLRADLDGKPRPIHTFHAENVLVKERKTSWVNDNLVQKPRLVRNGEDWAEYIVGEHALLYFSLRRLEFDKEIRDDTNGIFHVLNLVDGERTLIQSVEHPEFHYTQNFLDIVVVPANLGRYVIKNLGNQPVCVHKTILKEGVLDEGLSQH